jgi:putative PIN family toxin of toxin-antitoxin system
VFGGLPARAVERAAREEIWVSRDVRREWAALAAKLADKLTGDQLVAFKVRLVAVLAGAREAEVRRHLRVCRDPSDDAYLSLALAAQADVLLTGDHDLLSIRPDSLRTAGLGRLAILAPAPSWPGTGSGRR